MHTLLPNEIVHIVQLTDGNTYALSQLIEWNTNTLSHLMNEMRTDHVKNNVSFNYANMLNSVLKILPQPILLMEYM